MESLTWSLIRKRFHQYDLLVALIVMSSFSTLAYRSSLCDALALTNLASFV